MLKVAVSSQQKGLLFGLCLPYLVHLILGLPQLSKHSGVVFQLFNAVEELSI